LTDPRHALPENAIAVLISANGEWQAVKKRLLPVVLHNSPLGEWFLTDIDGVRLIFFHSGWGKTHSAASAQFVIDTFKPKVIINLGTCGGLVGFAEVGDIFLVTSTVMYDIFERMGNQFQASQFYSTRLDTSWLPNDLPAKTRRAPIASADQDIDKENFNLLTQEFGVPSADWESAAIAWVANKHSTRCLILRGVSDLISPTLSETDGNNALWHNRSEQIMEKLLLDLPFYLTYCFNE